MTDFSDYKARVRDSWEEGDYRVIAESTLPAAQALLDACAISAGQEVLDVAAGNGNLALLAAREGAAVVASDLTPGMVAMGEARTSAEGYDVEWCVADVESLPFDDGRFDCCASVFGAMFAPRPELAAEEMFRVVRPGGTVGLVSWTPEGFQGRVFAVGNKYVQMPEGVPVPSHWGIEETDWTDAPILAHPTYTRRLAGRVYDFYLTGSHIHMVVAHGPGNTRSWGENTLLDLISNETMVAVAMPQMATAARMVQSHIARPVAVAAGL